MSQIKVVFDLVGECDAPTNPLGEKMKNYIIKSVERKRKNGSTWVANVYQPACSICGSTQIENGKCVHCGNKMEV